MSINRETELRLLVRIIARNRAEDPVTIAERFLDSRDDLVDVLDDDGVSEPELQTSTSRRKVREIPRDPVEAEVPAAPVPPSSLALPGSKEFREALSTTEADRRKTRAAAPVRLNKVGSPAGKLAQGIQYWSYEDLIQEIGANTPPQLGFTPNQCPPDMTVIVDRNIQAEMGMNIVKLIYSHPGVAQGHGDTDPAGQLGSVSIDLTARHLFSLFDQNQDWDAALDNIVGQLKELFAPKNRTMSGRIPLGPPPMDNFQFEANPMRDQATIDGTKNWATVGTTTEMVTVGGHTYSVMSAAGSVLDGIKNSNRALGNRGAR